MRKNRKPKCNYLCIKALLWSLVLALSPFTLSANNDDQKLVVWHTFITGSEEEVLFAQAVDGFREIHPDISVEVVMIPYLQRVQQFVTASQGGQAPDIMRFANRDISQIGNIRVNGTPLLEDLSHHLYPNEITQIDQLAVNAMIYDEQLLGIPTSQSTLTAFYNKDIFIKNGVPFPDENWTLDEFLETAKKLTTESHYGLAIPTKFYYWYIAFQAGFGGKLFDDNGEPTLDSPGSAAALDWFVELETKHEVVAPGLGKLLESTKSKFANGNAAMTVDGSWNYPDYVREGINIGQVSLPIVDSTGLRVSPFITYAGWVVSKQSTEKVAAVELLKHLSSVEVQKRYALTAKLLPTNKTLFTDNDLVSIDILAGLLKQATYGTPTPSTRAYSLILDPLDVAIELVHSQRLQAQEALAKANDELKSKLRE